MEHDLLETSGLLLPRLAGGLFPAPIQICHSNRHGEDWPVARKFSAGMLVLKLWPFPLPMNKQHF